MWEALQKSSALCNEAWRGSCQTLPQCLFRAAGFTTARLSSCIPPVPFPTGTAPSLLSLPSLLPAAEPQETPEHLAGSFHSLFRDFNCSLPAVPNGAKQLNPELGNPKRSKAVKFQVRGVPSLSLCAVGAVVIVFSTQAACLLSPSLSLCDTDILAGPSVIMLLQAPTLPWLLQEENALHEFIRVGVVLASTTFGKQLSMDLLSVSFLIGRCLNQIWSELEGSRHWRKGREAVLWYKLENNFSMGRIFIG